MNETSVPKSVGLLLARKVTSMLFTDEIDFEVLHAMDVHENEKAAISHSHTHILSVDTMQDSFEIKLILNH